MHRLPGYSSAGAGEAAGAPETFVVRAHFEAFVSRSAGVPLDAFSVRVGMSVDDLLYVIGLGLVPEECLLRRGADVSLAQGAEARVAALLHGGEALKPVVVKLREEVDVEEDDIIALAAEDNGAAEGRGPIRIVAVHGQAHAAAPDFDRLLARLLGGE